MRLRRTIDRIAVATAEPVMSMRYMLRMVALAIVPTLIVCGFIVLMFQLLGSDFFNTIQKNDPTSLAFAVSSIIVAPIVETVVMMPVLWLLGTFIAQPVGIAALAGVLWGIVHVFEVGPFGMVLSWPFFIFSLMMLARRGRSLRSGYWRVVICHTLYNAFLIAVIFAATAAIA